MILYGFGLGQKIRPKFSKITLYKNSLAFSKISLTNFKNITKNRDDYNKSIT